MTDLRTASQVAAEYEKFVHIVAHDLSAPLRHIREFTTILTDSLEPHVRQDDRALTGYIRRAIEKLEKMQEALKAYSHVFTELVPFSEVNMALLVETVASRVHALHPSSAPQFKIAPDLPIIRGGQALLEAAFFNILDNALKFQKPNANPVVEISAHQDPSKSVFAIKDNGIGIAPSNHLQIFDMFQRLHTEEEFPGIGAGLTVAQKIVERHGGETWVASELQRGTTVYLSIPTLNN